MKVTIDEIMQALKMDGANFHRNLIAEQIKSHGIAPPDGYVLVPIEPTGKILLAGYNALTSTYFNKSPTEAMLEVYKAMLSAVKEKE